MKTFRLFGIALMSILLSMTACSDGGGEDNPTTPSEPEKPKSEIKIDSGITANGVTFTEKAGEQTVSFSTNEKWTLSMAETRNGTSWVTPSATSGNAGDATITFKVTENTDYDDRSVAVTIKAGTASITFKITQKGVDALLVTTTTYDVPQEGGTIDIEVKANIDYQMEISETAKSWITEASSRALTTHKHSLKIAANEELEKREGEIHFKSGDKVETVHVYQTGGAIILLSQSELTVSDKGETISVEIKSNCEYGVQMPDVDWITEDNTRAASSHTLKYIIAPNEGYDSRSAQIVYFDKNSDMADTLTITQAQKDAIILSKKEITVKSEGETIEVKLNSNVDFEIQMPDVNWLSQSKSRALKEHSLTFVISENKGEEAREAKIVFVNKNSGISDELSIKQKGFLNTTDVTIEEAGTLASILSDDMLDITSLKITGPLNGADIRTLRQMLGGGEFYSHQIGRLKNLDLTDASISNGIESEMFCGCKSLQSIQLPNGVTTIRDEAFSGCSSLTSVTIPESVTYIGDRAFYGCSSLTSVTIPDSVTYIENAAFSGCSSLTNVTIPDSVTYIENAAFSGCSSLTSVTIGNSVTTIGEYAFKNCSSLTNVTIPNSVTTIESYTFYGCSSLTNVTIPNSVTTIESDTFYGCSSLTNVTIPDSVTYIENDAFSGCSSLTSVIIGNGVTYINFDAFYNCSSLTNVTIPDSVTYIGYSAFSGCSSLTSVTIGNGVTSIEHGAFYNCKKLEKVYCYATTPPSIKNHKEGWSPGGYGYYTLYATFEKISESATLYIPKGTKTQYVTSDWRLYFQNIIVME